MNLLKTLLPVAILLSGLALNLSVGSAKVEYAKKEKKGCTTCHVTAKSADLNDTGKCYHDKKDLTACAASKAGN